MGLRKRVILLADSNFLMYLAEGLITPTHIIEALEAPYEIVVPSFVLEELERISESAPQAKTRRTARRALELLREGRIPHRPLEAPQRGSVDDSLIHLAVELRRRGERVIVATSDRGLRRRLRKTGVPSLYYRESSSGLEVEWLEP